LQQWLLTNSADPFTKYNNFIIFRSSFFHLIHFQDLYALYPTEHWDYYKYSPSFALLFGVFAYLPVFAGLLFWNMLNVLLLFFALRLFPLADQKIRTAALWFVLIELITTTQNDQSNALIAAMLIFAFSFFEKKHIALGTLMIVLTVFIKLFGLVAFSLFFLYPNKKKFILYSAMWMILLFLLPLLVYSPAQLLLSYQSWWQLLQMDFSGSLGISFAGWLHSWFHFDPPKNYVTLFGIILFCIPLLFYKRYSEYLFRILFLCNILIWVIIFNHKAESATFIIAVSGIALWYFTQQKNTFNFILLVLVFIFTCLSPTDLFPPILRQSLFVPYTLKVVPCILIWFKIIFDLSAATYSSNSLLQLNK
jgi:hypothetical protein